MNQSTAVTPTSWLHKDSPTRKLLGGAIGNMGEQFTLFNLRVHGANYRGELLSVVEPGCGIAQHIRCVRPFVRRPPLRRRDVRVYR